MAALNKFKENFNYFGVSAVPLDFLYTSAVRSVAVYIDLQVCVVTKFMSCNIYIYFRITESATIGENQSF